MAKHIHHEGFTIDTEGKDTWRHARAGARIIIGASPNELAVIKKTSEEAELEEIYRILRYHKLDVAFLEGFSSAHRGNRSIIKIVAAKNRRDLMYTLARTSRPVLAIAGPATRLRGPLRNARAPRFDIKKEGPVLASMIRRLLRPKELRKLLEQATVRHGEACIGLAIGVRAAYVASTAFPPDPADATRISCGTKSCIADAFKAVYPLKRIHIPKVRNDQINIQSRNRTLTIKLARKRRFRTVGEVLAASESTLFDSVSPAY